MLPKTSILKLCCYVTLSIVFIWIRNQVKDKKTKTRRCRSWLVPLLLSKLYNLNIVWCRFTRCVLGTSLIVCVPDWVTSCCKKSMQVKPPGCSSTLHPLLLQKIHPKTETCIPLWPPAQTLDPTTFSSIDLSVCSSQTDQLKPAALQNITSPRSENPALFFVPHQRKWALYSFFQALCSICASHLLWHILCKMFPCCCHSVGKPPASSRDVITFPPVWAVFF